MDRMYQCSDFSSSHKKTTEQDIIMKISESSGGNCSIPMDRRDQEEYWEGKRRSYVLPTFWCTDLPNGRAQSPRSTHETHLKAVEHILPPGQGLSRQPRPTIEQSRCPTLPGNRNSDPEQPRSPAYPWDQHLAPARRLNAACGLAQLWNPAFGPAQSPSQVCDHTQNGRQNQDPACCLSSPASNPAQLQRRHSVPAHQTQLPTCPWGPPVALHNSGHHAHFPLISEHSSHVRLHLRNRTWPRLNSVPGPPHHPIEKNGGHLIQPGMQGAQPGTLPKGTIQPLAPPCQGTPSWSLFWPGRGALVGPNLNREPTRLLHLHRGPLGTQPVANLEHRQCPPHPPRNQIAKPHTSRCCQLPPPVPWTELTCRLSFPLEEETTYSNADSKARTQRYKDHQKWGNAAITNRKEIEIYAALQILKKKELPYNSTVSLLSMYLKERKSVLKRNLHPYVRCSIFAIAKTWTQLKCSSFI